MKKLIVLILFGLLIMGFSAPAYAQKLEFKASGSIDWDTVLERNVPSCVGTTLVAQAAHIGIFQTYNLPTFYGTTSPPGAMGQPTGATNRTAGYSTTHGLLRFDMIIDPNLSGTFYFEIDAVRWGAATAGNLTQASFRNNLGAWATDQAAIEVKNVYFDVGLPYFGIPVPMTVRVGAQPIGVRPIMFLYTDGMGVTGGIKADPVMIIPIWAKILEGSDYASDDADAYGLHVNAKIGTITIGGYGLYYNMNTYPLQYMTGYSWGKVGGVTAATSAAFGLTVSGTQRADMWWFGGYMDGRIGPVDLNFDFVYDWGKVRQKLYKDYTVPDVKYSGWATRLKVDYPWEKFNFGGVFMYASGVDANKSSTSGVAGSLIANPYYQYNLPTAATYATKVGSYILPPGSEQSPATGVLANESIVVYSCFNAGADAGTGIAQAGNYQQMHRGAFGGTWFAKLYGSAKLLPWYKVTLQGLYIGDTTKHGNTLGTARQNPWADYIKQFLRDDKTIGWELDLINEFQIYKNLTWTIGAGYLWAGKALGVYNGWPNGTLPGPLGPYPYLGANVSLKNPWNLTTRLLFIF